MKLVKRCNDPIIALLIILLTFDVRLALQKINRFILTTSVPKESQTYVAFIESPSIPEGEAIFMESDQKS